MTTDRGWQGQSAIITGGAAGLGLALAHRLHSYGVHVAILDRSKDALDDAVERIGTNCHGYLADVTSEESVHAAIDDVMSSSSQRRTPVNGSKVSAGSLAVRSRNATPREPICR